MNTFLQLFLLLDVLLIGVVGAVAMRHARAHFRGDKNVVNSPSRDQAIETLPPAIKRRMLEAAELKFQNSLNKTSKQLESELDDTATRINKLLDHQVTGVVSTELAQYRAQLAKLRSETEASFGAASKEIVEHQAALREAMESAVSKEQAALIAQIDTKLADAVASFLTETLGHNVDLGAQATYLTSVLEEHKDEFKREISS
jgi:FAD/FMN-containing dehydrogenase